MKPIAQLPVIGLDIAKTVFQLHIVDIETGEIQRRQLKRAKVAEFFANREPSLVALEACGGAHYWARTLLALGHQVKLLPPKHVRAFVLRDKTDALDAQAIWVAAQQPHIKEVPVKSDQQQACLTLHRMRQQLMKIGIMQTNALRGLLYEFGIVLPVGHDKLMKFVQTELAKADQDSRLPGYVVVSVQEQIQRVTVLQNDIEELNRRLGAMLKQNQQMLAVQTIPGVGPLTATALVATVGDVSTFKSGRQFAAWLGLTPRQVGTGGKTKLERLLQRRNINVVVTALANKMARTIWAILAKGAAFDQEKWNPTKTAIA